MTESAASNYRDRLGNTDLREQARKAVANKLKKLYPDAMKSDFSDAQKSNLSRQIWAYLIDPKVQEGSDRCLQASEKNGRDALGDLKTQMGAEIERVALALHRREKVLGTIASLVRPETSFYQTKNHALALCDIYLNHITNRVFYHFTESGFTSVNARELTGLVLRGAVESYRKINPEREEASIQPTVHGLYRRDSVSGQWVPKTGMELASEERQVHDYWRGCKEALESAFRNLSDDQKRRGGR